jgi:hypothetical protein
MGEEPVTWQQSVGLVAGERAYMYCTDPYSVQCADSYGY